MPAAGSQVSCQGIPSMQSRWRQSPSTLGLPSATYKGFTREGRAPSCGAGGGDWMLWLHLSLAGAHGPHVGLGLWAGQGTAAEGAESGLAGRISPS